MNQNEPRLKRRLLLCMGGVLLLSSFGMASAQARTVSIGAEALGGAQTVVLPILIDDAAGIAGADLTLSFDPAVLVATDASTGSSTSDCHLKYNADTPGEVRISLARANALSGGRAVVVNVSFHLAPAVRGGDRTALRFSLAAPYDEAGRALAMQSQGMDFVVSAAHLGDPAGGSANGLTKPRITSVAAPQDGKFVLNWPSTTAAVYSVDWATNLNDGFHPLQSGIQATPPINSFTDSVNDAGSVFYRIRTE